MTDLQVAPLTVGECSMNARREVDALVAQFSGTADMRATEGIATWLLDLHGEAQKLGVGDVVVDMRDLEFMNSSCFKGFVSWITTMQEAEQARRYRVKFVSNPSLHWQRRSLPTLRCFATDLITIE